MTTHLPRTLFHVFPSFAVGGAQMRFVQLANHFGRAYRHFIVSMNGNIEAFAKLSGDLDAHLVTIPVEQGKTWPNVKVYRQVLKEVKPDLLITSNWGAIEWALANYDGLSPHLHMEDGFGPDEVSRQLPRRVWTRRLALRRSVVMLPSLTLHSIASRVWRLRKRTLLHIPNGVDCERFSIGANLEFAPRESETNPEPVIGTVAALRPEKNIPRLLDAFAKVLERRPARLVIVGDGPELPALKNRAEDLHVARHVTFTGATAKPEKLLPSFAVFALSSNTEQMPLSILEAMAAGRPVAATDVGDVRHMVCEENRPFVVTPEAPALAEAIITLLDNPNRARLIGEANARRARGGFDQSQMFASYRTLFDGARTEDRTRRTLSSQV
jgi:glycosyltransferase involved in cell wall biosynthesis